MNANRVDHSQGPAAALAQAEALRTIGRPKEALVIVEKSLGSNPDDFYLLCERARCLMTMTGLHNEAITSAERAIAVNPEHYFGYQILALIYASNASSSRSNEARRAVELARRAVALNAESTDTLVTLSFALRTTNDKREARAVAVRAVSISPDDPNALIQLALCEQDRNHHEAAREVLESVLAIDPENARVHRLLAKSYARRGRSGEAANELAAAKRLEPRSRIQDAQLQQIVAGHYGLTLLLGLAAIFILFSTLPVLVRVVLAGATLFEAFLVFRREGRVRPEVRRAVKQQSRLLSPLRVRLNILAGFLVALGAVFGAAGQLGFLEPQVVPSLRSAVFVFVAIVVFAPLSLWRAIRASADVAANESATFDKVLGLALLGNVSAAFGSIVAVVRLS